MTEQELKSWEHFKEVLSELERVREQRLRETGLSHVPAWLFRGIGDSRWDLRTTLERSTARSPFPVRHYFRGVRAIREELETFTNRSWAADFHEIEGNLTAKGSLAFYPFPFSGLLVYLRHHGFPSPLLDWSTSPYVAAHFAFRWRPADQKYVAIYAHMEGGDTHLRQGPMIRRYGSYVGGERRHFLQRSEYTVCVACVDDEWMFASHEQVFAQKMGPHVRKLLLPASAYDAARKDLHAFNINSFSLLGTEEALLETLALEKF